MSHNMLLSGGPASLLAQNFNSVEGGAVCWSIQVCW